MICHSWPFSRQPAKHLVVMSWQGSAARWTVDGHHHVRTCPLLDQMQGPKNHPEAMQIVLHPLTAGLPPLTEARGAAETGAGTGMMRECERIEAGM